VTGQIIRIDLGRLSAQIVNAGHPLPFRVRDGRAQEIVLDPDLPFGALDESTWTVQDLPLAPGDRLVFVSDGMLEREPGRLDFASMLQDSRDLHPREAIQYLMHAVLDAAGGELRDDAAALCLDWHGGPQRDRVSHAGAAATGSAP
jgi:serine phosphatase RsbU (regulator of sigma subunit)